jgi:hypothetical protein
MGNQEELFNIADFDGIKVSIHLENLTASTGFKRGVQSFGDLKVERADENTDVTLMEFQQDGVCLDAPYKIAAKGHLVKIHFEVSGAQLPFSFEATGQISEQDLLDERRERLVVKFIEVETRFFEALKNLFAERQNQIEQFLFQVKG